jgi:nucleoid-associated protein YgaU
MVEPALLPPATDAPAPIWAAGSLGGGSSESYQVQKGDTLFGIAKSRYGSGNQWQRIAAANPGVTPASLKAGATIVVP